MTNYFRNSDRTMLHALSTDVPMERNVRGLLPLPADSVELMIEEVYYMIQYLTRLETMRKMFYSGLKGNSKYRLLEDVCYCYAEEIVSTILNSPTTLSFSQFLNLFTNKGHRKLLYILD